MVLEIKKYGNPILKKKSEKVKELTPEIKELILNMKEMVANDKNIAGLAAVQVGVLKRIFAVGTSNGPKIFINPEIIEKSKQEEIIEEGCLSLPKIYIKIKRPKEIKLIAKNDEFEDIEINAKGIVARILQHELDHLNGFLMIDRLNFWQKLKIKNQLKTK